MESPHEAQECKAVPTTESVEEGGVKDVKKEGEPREEEETGLPFTQSMVSDYYEALSWPGDLGRRALKDLEDIKGDVTTSILAHHGVSMWYRAAFTVNFTAMDALYERGIRPQAVLKYEDGTYRMPPALVFLYQTDDHDVSRGPDHMDCNIICSYISQVRSEEIREIAALSLEHGSDLSMIMKMLRKESDSHVEIEEALALFEPLHERQLRVLKWLKKKLSYESDGTMKPKPSSGHSDAEGGGECKSGGGGGGGGSPVKNDGKQEVDDEEGRVCMNITFERQHPIVAAAVTKNVPCVTWLLSEGGFTKENLAPFYPACAIAIALLVHYEPPGLKEEMETIFQHMQRLKPESLTKEEESHVRTFELCVTEFLKKSTNEK